MNEALTIQNLATKLESFTDYILNKRLSPQS